MDIAFKKKGETWDKWGGFFEKNDSQHFVGRITNVQYIPPRNEMTFFRTMPFEKFVESQRGIHAFPGVPTAGANPSNSLLNGKVRRLREIWERVFARPAERLATDALPNDFFSDVDVHLPATVRKITIRRHPTRRNKGYVYTYDEDGKIKNPASYLIDLRDDRIRPHFAGKLYFTLANEMSQDLFFRLVNPTEKVCERIALLSKGKRWKLLLSLKKTKDSQHSLEASFDSIRPISRVASNKLNQSYRTKGLPLNHCSEPSAKPALLALNSTPNSLGSQKLENLPQKRIARQQQGANSIAPGYLNFLDEFFSSEPQPNTPNDCDLTAIINQFPQPPTQPPNRLQKKAPSEFPSTISGINSSLIDTNAAGRGVNSKRFPPFPPLNVNTTANAWKTDQGIEGNSPMPSSATSSKGDSLFSSIQSAHSSSTSLDDQSLFFDDSPMNSPMGSGTGEGKKKNSLPPVPPIPQKYKRGATFPSPDLLNGFEPLHGRSASEGNRKNGHKGR